MAAMKEFLLRKQEEEQELWESYLEFIAESEDLWKHLPKNLEDLLEAGADYE